MIEAAYNNQVEVMLLLIEKGVDLNYTDMVRTLFWYALISSALILCVFLQDNNTALMWACSEGRIEACTLLLQAGADVTVVNKVCDIHSNVIPMCRIF